LNQVGRQLDNPEYFYKNLPAGSTFVFDEIQRIDDPSKVLKIGSDEFPEIRILATGSSTLSATKKFKDSLTGRKTQLFLPPVLWNECVDDFKVNDINRRLFFGGGKKEITKRPKVYAFDTDFCGSTLY
jgi:predicted AAA+ superfamily ATPase